MLNPLTKILCVPFLLVACCLSAQDKASSRSESSRGVQITTLSDRLRVEINGGLFTEYCFKGAPRPYFYPLIGPSGAAMTRNWPMKETPGEEHDHVHHRGLWFGHQEVNGVHFWEETGRVGTIRHDKFLDVQSGTEFGLIKSANSWVSTSDNKVLVTDERTIRIYHRNDSRILDFDITLKAANEDVVFGDAKDGLIAIRVAETMRLKPNNFNTNQPHGNIVLSTGLRDAKAWGTRADWGDYHGPVDGKTVGVAIFDHPSNPRHPSWWHARDYGLFASNPFGANAFEQKPAGTGDLKIPAGGSVAFRYRFIFHEGDEKQGKIAEQYGEYIK